jgi:type I restriction enzyme, R subunit
VFPTIQKFWLSQADQQAGRSFPLLSDRLSVVVLVDEAQRSNHDVVDGFARQLRDGLPKSIPSLR